MFLVKNARRSDLEAILEIEKTSFKKPWDKNGFICEFSKQSAGINIFVIYTDDSNGRLLAYACGNIIADYVHIINIAVSAEYRRQGAAAALLRHIEGEAFRRGLGSITLEVSASNEAAVNLYKKHGFGVVSRREKAIDNRDDELIMWKKLF
ncbi:MAG: ribosomal protein S18-alanine N-acetyltransferase [Candidatus Goldiibacteriota bacterium]|jgi:ribosomal-protein-alanine N-acetyltransferase